MEDFLCGGIETAMAFKCLPIGVSDGLAQPRRFCLGRCRVSGCPGLENPLGAVEMLLVALIGSTVSILERLRSFGNYPSK